MKRILLPSDFSDCSRKAMEYALRLFEGNDIDFFLLHSTAIRASSMSILSSKLTETMQRQAYEDLSEEKEKILAELDYEPNIEIIVRGDDLREAIDHTVRKFHIDLVIMATHGTTRAKQLLFGSNTINILRGLKNCPILIVPQDYSFKTIDDIAFPTDYNRFYGNSELKPIREIAQMLEATVRVLHIQEEDNLETVQRYNLRALRDYFKDCKLELHWMPDYDKKSSEIRDFIEDVDTEMLVMVKYRHSIFEDLFHEPVIKKISFKPSVPFMVIPEYDESQH